MITTQEIAQQRVAAGIAWLDENYQGSGEGPWQAKIPTDHRLKMSMYSECVLGWVFDVSNNSDERPVGQRYWVGFMSAHDLTADRCVELGFNTQEGYHSPLDGVDYPTLRDAWVAYLTAWRAALMSARVGRGFEAQQPGTWR